MSMGFAELSVLAFLVGMAGSGLVSAFLTYRFPRWSLALAFLLPVGFAILAWPIGLYVGPLVFTCVEGADCGPAVFVLTLIATPAASGGGFVGAGLGVGFGWMMSRRSRA